MSLLGRVQRGSETRSTLSNPAEWLLTALGVNGSYSGETVNMETALGLAPYWRGVNLLSGAVGMLPCKVYERVPNGRHLEVDPESRAWTLLHDVANEDIGLGADEWWAIVESHVDTWGNHCSWKEPGPDGRIRNLWPIAPSRIQIGVVNGRRVFTVDGKAGYTSKDILHFRGLSLDGVLGYSPIQLHRHTLGAELARRKFQGKFWKNDATPGVVLRHPQSLKPESVDRIKALWDKHHRGPDNARRVAVVGEGIEIHQMTMPLEDAQFVEQARLSATEQALILGVPPGKVGGDTGGSMQYSTVEGESVDFLKWSLNARLVRLQRTVSTDRGDGGIMPANWFAEFIPDAILRTTTKERYEAYAQADWMTKDEKRAKENLEPLPDGQGATLSEPALKTFKLDDGADSVRSDGMASVVPIARRLAR